MLYLRFQQKFVIQDEKHGKHPSKKSKEYQWRMNRLSTKIFFIDIFVSYV